jgi:hypothetical protein
MAEAKPERKEKEKNPHADAQNWEDRVRLEMEAPHKWNETWGTYFNSGVPTVRVLWHYIVSYFFHLVVLFMFYFRITLLEFNTLKTSSRSYPVPRLLYRSMVGAILFQKLHRGIVEGKKCILKVPLTIFSVDKCL